MPHSGPASTSDQFLVAARVDTGALIDADRNIEAVTGWRPADLVGRSPGSLIHPDDHAVARSAAVRLQAFGKSRAGMRIRHADGTYLPYQVASTLGADGAAYHWFRGATTIVSSQADQELYRTLVELAADIFVVADKHGYIQAINPAGASIYGVSQHEMVGRHLLDFAPASGAGLLADIERRAHAGERVIEFRTPVLDHGGRTVHIEGYTTYDPDAERYYIVERNVTDRVVRERELAIGNRFFELARSHLAMVDNDGVVLRANAAFLECVGAPIDEILGRSLTDVLGEGDDGPLIDALRADARHSDEIQLEITTPAGPRTINCALTRADAGDAVYYSARDVTDEVRMAEELLDRATRDQLTRLATREVLEERVEHELAGGATVGLIMADLDDFKRVNDGLGHACGDELLRQVGQRIVGAIRGDDLVARFGGDEFVVLLRHVRSEEDARLAAEKVKAAVEHPYQLGSREVFPGVSLGVTVGSAATHDSTLLLREDDAAAYEAKRAGRSTIRAFNAGIEAAITRDHLVEDQLRSALSDGRIDIDVQGIFSTTGELFGIEALVRLVTEDGRRESPAHFLDVAERLGLLGRVGEAVADRAFAALGPWLRANPGVRVGLNADPVELAAPGWVEMIEAALERHRLDPGHLAIEVTERGLVDVGGPAGRAIQALRSLGVLVAIDDFGTGNSSLAYLRDRLIDVVKIDRSFTQQLGDDPVARSVTTAVLSLAGDLGMPAVAEGVEDASMLPLLAELGCPCAQGFGLHRPEPVGQFLASTALDVRVARPETIPTLDRVREIGLGSVPTTQLIG